MPSQQEVRWFQLKIGAIVLVAVVILTTLLFLMTSASGLGLFSRKLTVTTYFENAAGLQVGAAVNLEGVTIGTVKTIIVSTSAEHKQAPVQVVMKIDSKYQPELHTDSMAKLTTVGLLGDTVVDINSQFATGPELRDGGELRTQEAPNLEDVMKASQGTIDKLNAIADKLNTMMDDIDSGKGTLGQLITNPELYNKFVAVSDNIQQLSEKLNSSDNTAGKLLNDHAEMYNQINDIVAKADDIATDLRSGKGTAGKILTDDSAYNNFNESMKNLNTILADAKAGKGTAGMVLNDPAFAKKLDDSLTRIDDLLTGVDEGKGSVGKFLKDDAIYTNINNLLTNSNNLVTAIRQDPKKYLSFHMKIF